MHAETSSTDDEHGRSILHDPEVYPDAETFEPERFIEGGRLDLTGKDSDEAVFEFGLRVCHGRWDANDWNYLLVSQVLACFVFTAPCDVQDRPEHLAPDFSSGVIS